MPTSGKERFNYREEDTETIPAGKSFRNIEGPKSSRAGHPVPKYYPFEKTVYPSEQEAIGSAITRAEIQNYKTYGHPRNEEDIKSARKNSSPFERLGK